MRVQVSPLDVDQVRERPANPDQYVDDNVEISGAQLNKLPASTHRLFLLFVYFALSLLAPVVMCWCQLVFALFLKLTFKLFKR